jgi:hypothetical protein
MVRIFMSFSFCLEVGIRSSLFPLDLAGPLIADTERSVSRDEVDMRPWLDDEHRERGENAGDGGDNHRHVESPEQLRTALLQHAAEQCDGEERPGA